MNRLHAKYWRSFIILLVPALLGSCDNPFKDEEKKQLIREEYFYSAPQGRYVYYWDGKDEKGIYITPGKYIVLLEVYTFQDQDFVTAEEGGKTGQEDPGIYYYPEFWNKDELGEIKPNPFKIKSGCTITFILQGGTTAKLAIYKD
ncbi:hypothetical protein JXO59_09110 [candidate division KSB1 bacterium]|nr:hypothetical protein [candidate division KSB1 bacterium]